MEKYDENLEIEIYIEKTKSELLEEFELFKNTEEIRNLSRFNRLTLLIYFLLCLYSRVILTV